MSRMLTFLVLIILICFLNSCTSSTSALVYKNPKYDSYQTARVVVLPFKDAEGQVGSGEIVSSIFETTLLSTGKFEVVERRQLDKILAEQNLSLTGLIKDTISVGKLAKADVMIVGTVKTLQNGKGNGYTIITASIKGIHIETGMTLWSIDKTSSATDGLPMYSWDVVAKKLCRDMIDAFMEK
ncbi:MAG: CsgG/HfaB family protein [Bacteroidota bacterium]